VKRELRLTRNEDIKRVRLEGKSFARPSIVLGYLPNRFEKTRIAVIAGRSVGGAVQRNLAKRRIRSAIQGLLQEIRPGHDLVLIARRSILEQPYRLLVDTIRKLLAQAGLMKDDLS
jgi:ribonuclease P protein component